MLALFWPLDVAGLGLTVHGHFARLALAFDHQQFIAGIGRARQSQHTTGMTASRIDRLSASSNSARTRRIPGPISNGSPSFNVPRSTSTVATAPVPSRDWIR